MPEVDRSKLWVAAHVDPAGGPRASERRQTSRAAIAVVGQDDLERVFILEAWAKRIAPDLLIDRIFDTYERWRPAVFSIDASGPQLAFAQMVQKEARERGIKLPLRPIQLRQDKAFAIETTLQPVASSGRLLRPADNECRELAAEWKGFPDGMYRDLLDALACAIRLLPAVLPAHLRALSEGQLRTYLAQTGMPRDQIEERINQHRVARQ